MAKPDGCLFNDAQDVLEENNFNFIPSIGYRRHTANDMIWRVSFTPSLMNMYSCHGLGSQLASDFEDKYISQEKRG